MRGTKTTTTKPVAIPEDLHRELKLEAAARGEFLGDYVTDLLRKSPGRTK